MQGLNRVGRFGDQCKRYITKDTSLIDAEKELQYHASLMKFLSTNQKNKVVVAKLPPIQQEERKKKEPATTSRNTTTKTTPAVGKTGTKGKQNTSS